MSIATEITRLDLAKENLKTSINAKGGTLTTETIDDYYLAVDGISGGAARPSTPTGLTDGTITATTVELNWTDNATNEEWYLIETSLDGITWSGINVEVANTVTYTITGLTEGTDYWFRVAAYDTNENTVSDFSSELNITTKMIAPTVLTVTDITSTTVSLSWVDNSGAEAQYSVQMSTDNITWTDEEFTAANATSYEYTGLTAETLYYFRVAAYDTGVYSNFSNVVNDTTEAAPASLTGTLEWIVDNPDAEYGKRYGYGVAVNDSYTYVGSYESDIDGANKGRVYVYNNATGLDVTTISTPNTDGFDFFGRYIATNGTYLAISEYQYNSSNGAVHIYDVATHTLQLTIQNPDVYTGAADYFGSSVSMDENYLVVGAKGEASSTLESSAGIIHIYTPSGTYLRSIENPNHYGTQVGDGFGSAVAVDGSYLVAGVYSEDNINGGNVGVVYIFDPSDGSLLHTVENPNTYSNGVEDWFGYTVDTYGSKSVVNAYRTDLSGGANVGRVYIIDNTTGNVIYTIENPNTTTYFPSEVKINSEFVAIGHGTVNTVWLYKLSDGLLDITITNPNPYGTADGDGFGTYLDMNESYISVSAWAEDDAGGSSSGRTYIYT